MTGASSGQAWKKGADSFWGDENRDLNDGMGKILEDCWKVGKRKMKCLHTTFGGGLDDFVCKWISSEQVPTEKFSTVTSREAAATTFVRLEHKGFPFRGIEKQQKMLAIPKNFLPRNG